jgi:molecular chaperone GrpE
MELVVDEPLVVPTELEAQKERYLRLLAEFDNFKKRTRRDSELLAVAQKEGFIRELLPVVDNLERALACGSGTSIEAFHQGVEMTRLQLTKLLSHHGIEATVDKGELFDPHRHEALSIGHDPLQPNHSILEVVQRGYRHGDKTFRPAQVIVNNTDDPVVTDEAPPS